MVPLTVLLRGRFKAPSAAVPAWDAPPASVAPPALAPWGAPPLLAATASGPTSPPAPTPSPSAPSGGALPGAPSPPPTASEEPKGRLRPRPLVWLSLLGPGIISAAAGNDAGGIATYSQVGAQYGLHLLWGLALVTVGLIVVQEMCSRMGAVTGKGLAALIRENFGVKITLLAMFALVLANFAITVSEFAGISAVGEMFLGPGARYYVVPVAAAVVWLLVSRGSYVRVERVFIVASLIFATYIITALKIGVPWERVASATFTPRLSSLRWDGPLIVTLVTLIGTTISPYMQFYQQAATRDKGVTAKDYKLARWDSIVGCLASAAVAAFIIVACAATLYAHGLRNVASAGDAAAALQPIAGRFAKLLFAFGLLNASLMAAVVVPLSTAYAVTESLGWESGFGRRVRELPLFYGTYGALIGLGALLVVLLPPASNLIQIILNAQIINCALLPVELILMIVLVNRRRLMGRYRNGPLGNVVAWVTTAVAGSLSLFLLARQIYLAATHQSG